MLEAEITTPTGPGYVLDRDENESIAYVAQQALLHGRSFVIYRTRIGWKMAMMGVVLPCQEVKGVLHRLITIEVLSGVAVPQGSLKLLVLEDVTVTEKEVKP